LVFFQTFNPYCGFLQIWQLGLNFFEGKPAAASPFHSP